MPKFYAILILFLGEALSILAEVIAAKHFALDNNTFFKGFLRALPVIIFAGALLIAGYMLGLKAFKNIWVVSALSVTSIVIAEPIINYTITGQAPTRGGLIGLIFGCLGFVAALSL